MIMKKIMRVLAAGVLAASVLAGCGSSGSSSTGTSSAASSESAAAVSSGQEAAAAESSEGSADAAGTQTDGADSSAAAGTESSAASGNSNALIVYFDYSENMGDTSGMDVDAITSASLAGGSYDGITENDLLVMRDEIQKDTGADVFSVRVNETYDPDYNTMVGVAQDDQNNNKQFTFVEPLPDLSSYDVIYMGMPVWWGGLPQPMVNLVEQNDFSGKTIVPFGINLGSRFGRMIDQIKSAQPMATVSDDGLTENAHTANDQVRSDVDAWLQELASAGTITLAQ